MLKNKAQIAQEKIKTTLELPGPLSGPWTPAESEFCSVLVMCVRAHNLLCPPLNENPGSAPGNYLIILMSKLFSSSLIYFNTQTGNYI